MANPKTQNHTQPAPQAAPTGNPAPAQKVERVRKITSKLFKEIKLGVENGVKIAGTLSEEKNRTGQYGEYIVFRGDFRAIVGDTVYIASELILPAYPESVIHSGFIAAFNAAGEGGSVNAMFAFIVYRKDDSQNKQNARGFTWEVKEIHAMQLPDAKTDPLLKLLA